MMLLRPTITLLATATATGLGLGLTLSTLRASPLQCQYSASAPGIPDQSWTVNSPDPVARKQGSKAASGFLTPSNMRQISLGSVLGLVVGLGLRAFSRALVVLLGMGIVAVEWAAAKGYNLLPVNRVQKYVKGVDLQKAVSSRFPFKMSFGVTMGLAAFAQL
ncbi:hypothetical protein BO71DRAFT_398140 [Aspergillus ellipticus CBS 707.79]|uniref:FUN14-domain-containing protein n=1 Tax=Aspergillus ellipticus CBS 707.79 TaxID=1448320 RepID=A0A319DD90_9EURO|nr:hypothetical protein BO71DRAFT_398140 [Aspergillus ellipticus CBS 707.79]